MRIHRFKLKKIIQLTLMKLGLRCDLLGFVYLTTAIVYVISDMSLMSRLCGTLCTQVANRYEVSKPSIERSIRHAMDNSCSDLDFTELNRLFQSVFPDGVEKPTVGEIIGLVVEYYNLGFYNKYLSEVCL